MGISLPKSEIKMGALLNLCRKKFNPRDIPNLALWLDAADVGTLTRDITTNLVSQWNDKSGNGNHAVQAIGGIQPVFQPEGMNGLPTLKFTADALTVAHHASLNWTTCTIVCVVQRNTDIGNTDHRFLSMWDTAGGNRFIMRFKDDGAPDKYQYAQTPNGSDITVSTLSAGPSTGVPVIFTASSNGTNTTVAINGVADTTVGATFGGGTPTLVVGQNSASRDASVSEILIFASQLNSAELVNVTNYCKERWRIQ